ncbi:bifunctional DNA-formamidopyrimidine glycosylase/DNA-(apurinic or apyrimidinic site) lyase [Thiomicrorhabdus aquaedulcis]|uniref:bifunctional DNA-formamidopyrimidine glycosylase/DNA-(apurinic or apyrimidinic site) lyase n=1 Tax=Thiomicrorhabdus aquaedulcis TaxID=2211106 RepID=UPI000FD9EB7C|nr:bifunctional DNA-formamidopyrimidine glycosylase/DNA-(apurinic or apyrimidinic site) lyase [Thiomicrorhabdus aquaedulcis]
MPELPEVETTRKGIQPKTQQQTISHVVIRNASLRWPVDLNLINTLPGLVINSVTRRGKYILLNTPAGSLLMHLGMSGNLRIVPLGTALQKHDHVDIELANQHVLRFNDPRRFGSILWQDQQDGTPLTHPLLAKLGPEPLSDDFNGDYLFAQTRGRKVAIKTWVMNSQMVVGAGNIYANEALFMSHIHPQTLANNLNQSQCDTLAKNIKRVLNAAIKQGGTTLKDFVTPDGKPGYFAQSLNVYGRQDQACLQCQTPIQKVVLNQRATFFCPHCQPR